MSSDQIIHLVGIILLIGIILFLFYGAIKEVTNLKDKRNENETKKDDKSD